MTAQKLRQEARKLAHEDTKKWTRDGGWKRYQIIVQQLKELEREAAS